MIGSVAGSEIAATKDPAKVRLTTLNDASPVRPPVSRVLKGESIDTYGVLMVSPRTAGTNAVAMKRSFISSERVCEGIIETERRLGERGCLKKRETKRSRG